MSLPEFSEQVGGDLSAWEGEPVSVLRGLWSVPFLEVFRTIGSTNDRARELKLYGRPDRSVVLAEEQTAGRGRGGRRWHSAGGGGIWMSWIAPPQSDPATASLLPLLVGIAVAEAIEVECPGIEVGIKWPNDLLIAGQKCAGILCERAGDRVVIGVGINVRPFDEDTARALPDATSLEAAGGMRFSRVGLMGRILSRLEKWVGSPVPGRLEMAQTELKKRDVLRGLAISVTSGGGVVRGIARGIDLDGALELEQAGGNIRRVWAGSVRIDRRHTGGEAKPPARRDGEPEEP